MTFTTDDLAYLASEAGARLLDQLRDEDLRDSQTLALIDRLRRQHDAAQARAALAMARLRLLAVDKFGADAAQMFFTAEALEQASDPLARAYRAGAVAGARVVDAGCGIGADSIALARAGCAVEAIEIDPARAWIAAYNLRALGLPGVVYTANLTEGLPPGEVVFFDPARRAGERRVFDVEAYQPPLGTIRAWADRRVVVKLAPGVDLAQLAPYGGAVEFISVAGDLKEAVLWRGFDRPALRATLLRGAAVHHWDAGAEPAPHRLSPPRTWLIEPDPALLRAGLVTDAALALDAYQLDESIAYLTTDNPPDSPWVRGWRVRDWMPFQLKRLRAYLRERGIGRVTVKKRGVALTPEGLTADLRLKGAESCTLVMTRAAGRPIALICDDYAG